MFILVLGSILALMHLYVWKRMVKDTTGPGRLRWLLTGLVVALLLLLMAALVVPRVFGVAESGWLAWPGYLWFGLLVYLFLALLVLEPVRWLLRRRQIRTRPGPETRPDPAPESAPAETPAVDRRMFLARASAVAAGAAAVGLVGTGAATALGPPQLLRVPVRLPRLDRAFDGYRIAVVSDIHLGPLLGRAHTERIVRIINEAEPDLVAVVGDVVDGTVAELGAAAAPLQDLQTRDGAFFVTGNHEYFVDDTDEWIRELERLGLQPLRNENTRIRRGAAGFDLAGVNDIAGAQHSDAPDFDRALTGLNPQDPTILLAHQPVEVSRAAERGVDLQLSGHTHGGQMWPFHYAVALAQPALAGLSRVGDTQLYVTRGAGFWGPPVRVGAPPDISLLNLRVDEV
ncbi:metallophosphoesterase [Mycolicibacterium vaccae]|uniref:Integral membrane protein n=2 Tax=Mycolicibacterium vaccae TaxID=1810 RepID=K0UYK6_MYCVA|nr:metallophosphoesterase [Mycolicibacterium vaccae]ANI38532.1 metallophosphatase [Mycolicibacterium vaccae 95051]EJZ11841.1 integral membrane protein [Mycolicibacterium vaccae ATCC 25954]MCV7061437.1 metallophosphoesterase [Mycolicibacterium vaccae]